MTRAYATLHSRFVKLTAPEERVRRLEQHLNLLALEAG